MDTNFKPDFNVYTVIEYTKGKEKKARWLQIGAAWANKDGEGINVQLDALPIDGKLVLRVPKAKEEPQTAE
jgi:hypothetical protein